MVGASGARSGFLSLLQLAAFLAVQRVVKHDPSGVVRVPGSNGLQDVAVFAGRHRQHTHTGQLAAPDQRNFLDQLAVDGGQFAVARHLDQPVVEAQIKLVVGLLALRLPYSLAPSQLSRPKN